jgi:isopropylmalate/citramalate/homocitrate synthase-like protein
MSTSIGKVRIFDTTLRDGEQTPGASLTPDEKVVIARQLDRLGVDAIEAGTPITSKGELMGVKLVAREGLKAEIYGLARMLIEDVDAVLETDVNHVHLFIATSDIHLKHKLRMTREQALQRTLEIIDYAKDHGLIVEFSAEDASRTDLTYLKRVYKEVDEAGVTRLNIPDTVGIMTPKMMYNLVKEVKSTVKTPISVHCHNDFGMAVANTLAGVEAGADQAQVSVNGLGERAGNASLEEVVIALNLLYKKRSNVVPELIYQTSQLVARLTGIPVQPNKAVVGENAFTHEAGIHTHGITALPLTYEPIDPKLVGRRRKLVAGKHAGAHGIKVELDELGLHPSDEQLQEIVVKVKEIGDRGRIVTDAELIDIARYVMGEAAVEEEKIIILEELAVMTGTRMIPTASVRVVLDGKDFSSAQTGVGPVDAAMKAIQTITSSIVNVNLKEYRLEALTGGSNAVAEVIIKVEDVDGNSVSSRSAHEDIVKASVNAMITGINKLLIRRRLHSKE